jgi:hypothetical protein
MKKGNVKDLYPQTFELVHEKINETEKLLSVLLHRNDAEDYFTRKDIEKVEDLITELVDYWLCFDVDFPKENIAGNNQDQIIEDYIWLEHLIFEIEDVYEQLEDQKSKLAMYTLYKWIVEMKSVLEK